MQTCSVKVANQFLLSQLTSSSSIAQHFLLLWIAAPPLARSLAASSSLSLSHSFILSPSGVVSLRLGVLPPAGKGKGAARERGQDGRWGGGGGGEEGVDGGSQVVPDERQEGNFGHMNWPCVEAGGVLCSRRFTSNSSLIQTRQQKFE